MHELCRAARHRALGCAPGHALGRTLGAAAALLALAATPARGAEGESGWHYEPGHGLRNAELGLALGGYLTAEVQKLSGVPSQTRISHSSLFLWWEPNERWKLLAELDQENVLARDRQDRPGRPPAASSERRADLQRLYANWTWSDALVLRAGKFLTPVGRWNQLHADPLTWTSNRPLITQSVLPNNLTGLMASGQLDALGAAGLEYALYASNGAEWAPDPRQDLFSSVRGGRLTWSPTPAWQLGLSLADYEQRGSRGQERRLSGLDLRWAQAGVELTAEWLRTANLGAAVAPPPTRVPGPFPSPNAPAGDVPATGQGGTAFVFSTLGMPTRGAYLQLVVPIAQGWYTVAREERYRDSTAAESLRLSTLGVVWRSPSALVFKLEHQWASGRSDLARDGWTASLSLLF